MDSDERRFEVTKLSQKKPSWFTFLLDGLLTLGTATDTSGKVKYPEIVVSNSAGERRVLEIAFADEEAHSRLSTIEDDYGTLVIAGWCELILCPSRLSGDDTVRRDEA